MSADLKKNPIIDSFLTNLLLEKGLSKNTLKAYSNDCYAFTAWLSSKKHELLQVSEKDIENYLKNFHRINLSHSSINRKISSFNDNTYYERRRPMFNRGL